MPSVRELLPSLRQLSPAALQAKAFKGLDQAAIDALSRRGQTVYSGKVRDVISHGASELVILHSDRLTAFDRLIGLVPEKGTILNALSAYWLRETSRVLPTHYLGVQGPRALLCLKTQPIKIEVVVRGYLAGNLQRIYKSGQRSYCGQLLAEGWRDYQQLPEPIITPTTKAAAFEHDVAASAEDLIRAGACSAKEWEKIATMAKTLFAFGSELLGSKGWILADTKYEFGRDAKGEILVIDEVHTPDSSRMWERHSYQSRLDQGLEPTMLDKENVRRYLMAQGFSGHGEVPVVPAPHLLDLAMTYLDVAEKLTGKTIAAAGASAGLSGNL